MKKTVAKMWVKALRSGHYRQTRGQLRSNKGPTAFCCLGVLCDLHAKQTGKGRWDKSIYTTVSGTSHCGVPTKEVLEWAGLWLAVPRMILSFGHVAITALNDEDKFTFKEIADLIEKQWEDM